MADEALVTAEIRPVRLSARDIAWRALYGVSGVTVFAVLRDLLFPEMKSQMPLALLLVPLIICTIYAGGIATGIAAAYAFLISPFFLLEPRMSWAIASVQQQKQLLVFSFMCVALTLLAALLQRSRQKAHQLLYNLQYSEQTMRAILESAGSAVIGLDQQDHIVMANGGLQRIFGYETAEVLGKPISILVPAGEEDDGSVASERGLAVNVLASDAHEGRELLARHMDGTVFPIEVTVAVAQTPGGPMAVAHLSDITKRKQVEARALFAAQHDPLTGLPSRALVYELSAQMLLSAQRNGTKLAFLFFDLDRFKPVNDTYGHETGDRMLQEVAARLRRGARANDVVGRIGGDEFIAVMDGVDNAADILRAARHLLTVLGQPYHIDALELRTSPSIGISLYPDDAADVGTLIRQADAAMYHAKHAGRNTYRFFTPEIGFGAEKVFVLEQRLRKSISQREFALVYQPIVDLGSMRAVGAEALIRWHTADGEIIMPESFIAAAEASGLIHQIGEWVLEEACRQHALWRAQGLPPIHLAVNVSPTQFHAADFPQRTAQIIEKAGVDADCFELEVTEGTIMQHVEATAKTLAGLKKMGLTIALDDFGTGYSSLRYLLQFPIDRLKIDQSFVKLILHDPRSVAIVETVITLGGKLGVQVVAEGVESQAALDALREQGCHLGQGHFISRPLSGEAFAKWYRQQNGDAPAP